MIYIVLSEIDSKEYTKYQNKTALGDLRVYVGEYKDCRCGCIFFELKY